MLWNPFGKGSSLESCLRGKGIHFSHGDAMFLSFLFLSLLNFKFHIFILTGPVACFNVRKLNILFNILLLFISTHLFPTCTHVLYIIHIIVISKSRVDDDK